VIPPHHPSGSTAAPLFVGAIFPLHFSKHSDLAVQLVTLSATTHAPC